MLFAFLFGLLIGGLGSVLLLLRVTVPRLEQLYVFRLSREVLNTPRQDGVPYVLRLLNSFQFLERAHRPSLGG